MKTAMYYYNQNDYSDLTYNKPNGEKATIASGGCGVVSACIAVNNACGKELYTVKQMRDLAQSCGARINNGTDIDKLLKAVCKAHPAFSYKATQLNNDLLAHLKNGGKAVINQGDVYNVFSTAGHFVAAVQLFDNDVVDVYDPQMYSGKYQQYQRPSRIQMATKYGARVKINEISKATADRNPCYWLITYTQPQTEYIIGKSFKSKKDLYVYASPNGRRCKISDVTQYKCDSMATLPKGTNISVAEIKTVNNKIWIRYGTNRWVCP